MGCTSSIIISNTIPTLPSRAIKNPPDKIVVGNAFDVTKAEVREKKEKLFAELVDLTVRHTSNEINRRTEIPASFEEGQTVNSNQPDSSVQALMTRNRASHAIIVNSFEAFMEQTHVEVTETEGSKSKRAYYDIIVEIGYSFHNWSGHQFDTLISVRRFHSSRMVLSGLLAVGPGIVSNSSDASEGIFANVDLYLNSFFTGRANRDRMLHVTKEFKPVGDAIRQADFNTAFLHSERLMTSADAAIAAKAAFNCAVILEHEGKYNQVKYYLDESLRFGKLTEARSMMDDYWVYR